MVEQIDEAFEALLVFMRDSRGFDFTGYKRDSLTRRVQHRMKQVGCEKFEDYQNILEAHPDEFGTLFNTILINVTAFFRDPDAWDVIRDRVIPDILAERSPSADIRVWSAGCATGEEAYTLAILLAEAMGPDEFQQRVKIYATDIDEHALAIARAATYDAKAVSPIPPDLLAKYFEIVDSHYVFRKDLRRSIIFGRNDLVKDAPISRVDLLVCRNTLMYLNSDTQKHVLSRLHFALAPHGILFLGHAEMMLSQSAGFTPLASKNRIFRKAPGGRGDGESLHPPVAVAAERRQSELSSLAAIRELAFRASPVAQIVVNSQDIIAMINHQAEITFGLAARDIGRPLQDLELSYRPAELRTYVERAKVERRSARIQSVEWQRPSGDTAWFEIHVNPLVDNLNGLLGVSIVFFDVTSTRLLLDKAVDTNSLLESAYGELQSSNEELETTNEELQSTIEELETTNEELQSTNEELETMNEELQSTNDQLQNTNNTLRDCTVELTDTRTFLNSLVDSIKLGIVVMDRELRVSVWNRACEELWGVRAEEAKGAEFTALDIGLPMETLTPMLAKALIESGSAGETLIEAVNRRGKQTTVRVTCSPFKSREGTLSGALLLMEPTSGR